MTIPIQIKTLVPGYRAKWRRRYACMLREIEAIVPRLSFGADDDPWISLENGPRLFGYFTEPNNEDVFHILKPYLPQSLPKSHFRLVKDCVNRYVYPHMRPDLSPVSSGVEEMFGFHGQHKDSISDTQNPDTRKILNGAFMIQPDDVILDCGAFLGFGDLRVARDTRQGHIYAIEADSDCHRLLQRNVSENHISNISSVHRAVWNCETELELESDFAQANTLLRDVHTGSYTQKTQTITIDGAVTHFGIEKLDFVSLTLNGAEVEALEGAQNTLEKLRPRIRIAGWYMRDERSVAEHCEPILREAGYSVYLGHRSGVLAIPRKT